MYLRSFSYGQYLGVDELPEDVLKLFTSLTKDPDKRVEYAGEIVTAGLLGRIDFSKEFNLDGYEAAIKKNQYLLKEGQKKKKSYLDFSGQGDDFSDVTSSGGLKADFVEFGAIKDMKDAFEEVLLDENLQYAVSTIKSLNNDFISDYGTDIIFLLKKAVGGIPQAIEEIKQLCSDFSIVSELIEIILSSNKEIDTLFA